MPQDLAWVLVFMLMALPAIRTSTAGPVAVVAGPVVNPANGHSYFHLADSTWTDAEAQAIALGGHLVTINDAAENQFVIEQFGQSWIGLSDARQEGTFVWSSGELVTFDNGTNFLKDTVEADVQDYVYAYPSGDIGIIWAPIDNRPAFTGGVVEATTTTAIPLPAALPALPVGLAVLMLAARNFLSNSASQRRARVGRRS